MDTKHRFYVVIIGSEILNGRREDRHFKFVRDILLESGYEIFASFIIKDDPILIENIFNQVKSDEKSVMFSFGGIGSTPDDLTREIAAKAFTSQPLLRDKKFEQDIIDRFKEEAYPYRVLMSDIPNGSKLLQNIVNNMSGFSLEDRYFFVPGFPTMSHPMITDVMKRYFPRVDKSYRKTLIAKTSENYLINVMRKLPKNIELSSLPMFVDGEPNVELSISAKDKIECEKYFLLFIEELNRIGVEYRIIDISDG